MTFPQRVSKKNIKKFLSPFIYKNLKEKTYKISLEDPRKVLSGKRIDFGFRKIFCEMIRLHPKLADEVYMHDIKAQTEGTFEDTHHFDKKNFSDFKNQFLSLIHNMQNGFDRKISLIPVSKSGTIMDGSHRLATAIHLKKKIYVLHTNLPDMVCDYKFYSKRLMPENILEMGISKCLEYMPNTYVAFLWSSGKKNWSKSEKYFSNIIYQKKISLTWQGKFNLLYYCYKKMSWIGDVKNNFKGLQQKRVECFPSFKDNSVKIIFFQGNKGLQQVKNLKKKIRKINKLGYSSIHITDNKDELSFLSDILLNKNSLHFLNHSVNTKFFLSKKFKNLKKIIQNRKMHTNHFVVDGSFVLELYGLRRAKDFDLLVNNDFKTYVKAKLSRDDELYFHGTKKNNLIYNPRYFFILDKIKIISLKQLIKFKKLRGEKKDIQDINISKKILYKFSEKNKMSFINYIFYLYIFFKRKIKNSIIRILQYLSLYYFVRSILKK